MHTSFQSHVKFQSQWTLKRPIMNFSSILYRPNLEILAHNPHFLFNVPDILQAQYCLEMKHIGLGAQWNFFQNLGPQEAHELSPLSYVCSPRPCNPKIAHQTDGLRNSLSPYVQPTIKIMVLIPQPIKSKPTNFQPNQRPLG